MWEKILTVVSLLAVPANAIIIAFLSKWVSDQLEKYYEGNDDKILVARFVFILIFEVSDFYCMSLLVEGIIIY